MGSMRTQYTGDGTIQTGNTQAAAPSPWLSRPVRRFDFASAIPDNTQLSCGRHRAAALRIASAVRANTVFARPNAKVPA
jgi:hypothetical protein